MCDLSTPHGRQLAVLKHALDRAASEVVGASALYTHLRGTTGFEGHQKGLEFLATLETKRDEAKAAWEAAGQPLAYATREQRQDIVRLLNHPHISNDEKSECLLKLPKLSAEGASAVIIGLKLDINAREGRAIYADVLGYTVRDGQVVTAAYGVVGEAYQVAEQQAA